MYAKLQDLWRQERERKEIVAIDPAYYGVLREYTRKVERKLAEEKNELAKLLQERRLERFNFILNDLIEIRTLKLIKMIVQCESLTVNLSNEEIAFFNRFKKVYEVYRDEIFNPQNVPFFDFDEVIEEKEKKDIIIEHVAIRLTKEIKDPIICLDGHTYGPFAEEEVVILPKENATILVKNKIAEQINDSK